MILDSLKPLACAAALALVAACAPAVPTHGAATVPDTPSASEADRFLNTIRELVERGALDDAAFVSQRFGITLSDGALENGTGGMVQQCAPFDALGARHWVARRYHYQQVPAYFSGAPHPKASSCTYPYVVNLTDPKAVAAFMSVEIDTDALCITEADVKRDLPGAWVAEFSGVFAVKYRRPRLDEDMAVNMQSTHRGKICVKQIAIEKNNRARLGPDF